MPDGRSHSTALRDAGQEELHNDEARHTAVSRLGSAGTASLSELVNFLGDASWRVRKAAVWATDRFAAVPGLADTLIAGLGSDNSGLRVACWESLVRAGPAMVHPLSAALNSADPGHRKFIVEVLGVLGTAAACDVLLCELDDLDENVAAAAAEALGNIGGERVVDRLRTRLKTTHGNLLQSTFVLAALAKARAMLTLDELLPLTSQPTVSRDLYALLALTRESAVVDVLCAALETGAEGHRIAALVALADLGVSTGPLVRDRIVSTLLSRGGAKAYVRESLTSESDAAARAAVEVLGFFQDPQNAPSLLHACACRPFVDRGVAAVVKMGRDVLSPLVAALDRVDVETRVLILDVLEVIGDSHIVAEIAGRIGGFDSRSAESAVRVLASLGGEEAVDALIALSRSISGDLSRPLALSLANLLSRTDVAAANRVRQLLDTEGPRAVWLIALGSLAEAQDVARIKGALHHRDGEIRRAATEATLAFGAAFPEESLVLALADENPAVRALAARGLEAFGSQDAVNALLTAVKDPVPWVVAEALRALGSGRGPAVVHTLLSAAQSTSSPIAIAALQSLFRVNPPEIGEAIAHAVRHADPEVVREAISLTMRLSADAAAAVLCPCLMHRSWNVRCAAAENLSSRRLPVPLEVLRERFAAEAEPLVREALEPLLVAAGAGA